MKADFIVVGAGIVGLAAAGELARRNPGARITVLEKENGAGLHASGRNSGVLHSGIYYRPDSLKAKVCSAGARKMIRFAEEHRVPYSQGGKVIVATSPKEVPALDRLAQNAAANRITVERLDAAGLMRYEPHACVSEGALYVRDTAVIDIRAVIAALEKLLRERGVEILYGEKVLGADPGASTLTTARNRYSYGYLVNCGGAFADTLARRFGLGKEFFLVPFKGIYYQLAPARSDLVRSNIYPVPDEAFPFLGVHFTRKVSGEVYVGPTAIPAFGRENYGFLKGLRLGEASQIVACLSRMMLARDPLFRNLARREFLYYYKPYFVSQARALVPEVRPEDLTLSAKVGIRPQLINLRTGRLEMDYVIRRTANTLHVLNAISPAFTSAFAFAEFLGDEIAKPAPQLSNSGGVC